MLKFDFGHHCSMAQLIFYLPACLLVLRCPFPCDKRYTNNLTGSKLLNYWKALSLLLGTEGSKTL
jgi:hypothetical protein